MDDPLTVDFGHGVAGLNGQLRCTGGLEGPVAIEDLGQVLLDALLTDGGSFLESRGGSILESV